MVTILDLWLPILLSAVVVFIASSIIHMVLPIHRNDYAKIPDEETRLEALRGIPPGDYVFPRPDDPKDMQSEEMKEKYERGPVGFLTVIEKFGMGKNLVFWFVYLLVIGVFVAYITGRSLGPGSDYLAVFRIAGTAAILGYAGAEAHASIWWGRAWSTTFKFIVDSVFYGLLTAGVFGWLWPPV